MRAQVLRPDQVHDYWPRLSALLARSVNRSEWELEVEDIPKLVDERKMFISAVFDDRDCLCAAVALEILTCPRMRILQVTHVGGQNAFLSGSLFSHLEDLAKALKCDTIQGFCRPAAARLFARVFGLKPVYTVLRREVDL
jgi:hypothetical protein